MCCLFVGIALPDASSQSWWFAPVDTASVEKWVEIVQREGGVIRFRSAWMPVFSATIDEEKLIGFDSTFIRIQPVLKLRSAGINSVYLSSYSKALEQMQGKAFQKAWLSGLGVKIGVTDAGFLFLNDSTHFYGLHHLWTGGQIKGTKLS